MISVLSQQELEDLIQQSYKEAEGTRDLLFRQKITIINALEQLKRKMILDEEISKRQKALRDWQHGKIARIFDIEISDFHDQKDNSSGMKINEEFENKLVH